MAVDLFTDTNGTLLTDHALDSGGSWSKLTLAGVYTGDIFGNVARHIQTSPRGTGLHYTEIGVSNMVGSVVAQSNDGEATLDLIFRYVDADNWWAASAYITGGSLRILRRLSGTITVQSSAAMTLAINTDYTLEISAVGTAISASINGVTVSLTSSIHQTATKAGLGTTNSAANKTTLFDNFSVGPVGQQRRTAQQSIRSTF
jgi:hypothetical protein